MRVLQINTVCGFGSTGRIVTDLAKYVKSVGGECEIAYGRSSANPKYDNTFFVGSDIDHKIHAALSRVTDRQGFYSNHATKRLIKHIEDTNPDVIHLHNLHGYYLNIKDFFPFLKEYKKPVIWTLHDCWPFTGHCTYFDIAGCEKWRYGCERCPQKKEYPKSILYDNSRRNFFEKKELYTGFDNLHLVTPSAWLANLVNQSFLSELDCRVINNGINLESIRPRESNLRDRLGINEKTVLLGVASIWGKRKGFDDFLKLAEIIDNKTTAIIMIGLSESQLSSLPENIIGIKRTNDLNELCEYYTAADFFLNLTYQDNFPTTNIEALACGTPVITYRTGGSVESITTNCGAIVEKGEYQKTIELIRNNCFMESDCIERAKIYDANMKYEEYYKLYCALI